MQAIVRACAVKFNRDPRSLGSYVPVMFWRQPCGSTSFKAIETHCLLPWQAFACQPPEWPCPSCVANVLRMFHEMHTQTCVQTNTHLHTGYCRGIGRGRKHPPNGCKDIAAQQAGSSGSGEYGQASDWRYGMGACDHLRRQYLRASNA